jgi:hypothetical protein
MGGEQFLAEVGGKPAFGRKASNGREVPVDGGD